MQRLFPATNKVDQATSERRISVGGQQRKGNRLPAGIDGGREGEGVEEAELRSTEREAEEKMARERKRSRREGRGTGE